MLGFLWGAAYDIVVTAEWLLASKPLEHLLDFLSALAGGAAFVCCLIGYGDGSFRGVYLVACLGGIVIYLITIHRVFHLLRKKMTKTLQKRRRKPPKK